MDSAQGIKDDKSQGPWSIDLEKSSPGRSMRMENSGKKVLVEKGRSAS